MSSIYEMNVKDNKGESISLGDYKGKVLLIVNTATGCGFTPQYQGLQEMYEKYNEQGFEILDFPCNQFGNQAPGSSDEIATFCTGRFGIKFKQFENIDVNGDNESPLYTYLKNEKKGKLGKNIKWNFEKFLIDREGNVVKRFASTTTPKKIEKDVEKII